MTYDLIAWPVDRALTLEEAVAEVGRLGGSMPFGLGHDRRLDPFIAAMEKRYPGLRGRGPAEPPIEFDVLRRHVFMGIPWNEVEAFVTEVAEVAFASGLAVFDPQREALGLPAPFADAPLTSDGVEPHVRKANEAFAAIERGAAMSAGDDPVDLQRAVSGQLSAAGFRQESPLGYEITPDVEAEFLADPLRMASSLQTPERKAQLIADMGSASPGARHVALSQLAGWDPDPEVATALRSALASEDVLETGLAAGGLARQGDITDLPAVLDLVYRMSPADGGSAEAMLMPLRAALDLAAPAGSMAVDGVRARARTWRGEPRSRRQAWEGEIDRELDRLLGERR